MLVVKAVEPATWRSKILQKLGFSFWRKRSRNRLNEIFEVQCFFGGDGHCFQIEMKARRRDRLGITIPTMARPMTTGPDMISHACSWYTLHRHRLHCISLHSLSLVNRNLRKRPRQRQRQSLQLRTRASLFQSIKQQSSSIREVTMMTSLHLQSF